MRNTCVISGLSPGFGGVPRLLEFLLDYNELIIPRRDKTYCSIKVVNKVIMFTSWILRVLFTRSREATIIHHFSIPTVLLLIIAIKFRKVHYFAIDNSYFCLKSYNYKDRTSCLDCLGKNFPMRESKSCQPFPNRKSKISLKIEGLLIAHWIRENISYTLCESSAKIMSMHFKKIKETEVLNFSTLELKECIEEMRSDSERQDIQKLKPEKKFNFVFHGAQKSAKGYDYAISLAKQLPEFSFLFPFEIKKEHETLSNVTGLDMRWENGLKTHIKMADCVLCPSLWTYTPEAALLKSFIYNDAVLYMDVPGSFSDDIPDGIGIRGTGYIHADVEILRNHLAKDTIELKKDAQEFVKKFIEKFELHLDS